ncbi:hypothetical protein KSD_82110 [Ktedonobacter sp. SOSP1-85]|nr:hypothetical protein KSD_82110 [Ktedonobacter sp. SOSP1-85]
MLLAPFVPQLEIPPRARVFVTHGGVNSVMESLSYGVPMVVIPQETLDQMITARRLAELGLSLALAQAEITVGRFREAVERVATGETIHQNGKHMQRLAREAGGYRRAVEAIMHFAQERTR